MMKRPSRVSQQPLSENNKVNSKINAPRGVDPPASRIKSKQKTVVPLLVLPFGVKLLIGYFLFLIVMWVVGQGGSVVAYDYIASIGLQQETRDNADPVMIEVNRAIGLADVMLAVPLYLVAIHGLRKLQFYGAVASWLVCGTNLYWPIVAWAKQSFYIQAELRCEPFGVAIHTTLAFVFLSSLWATWYLYKNRMLFV